MSALSFVIAMLSAGCSWTFDLGWNDRDAANHQADGGVYRRVDVCGNGIDDDQNGRIDDRCPCAPGETQACFDGPLASRRVGLCRDGIQICRTSTGIEWGDWGDSPCEGALLPSAEQCDGLDHDCDGARDEECPCSAGESRSCGVEFLSAPCRAGTQRCTAAGWSECEGAISPTADLCDGIDNDCDGVVDPNCSCVPEAERCDDGMDNDCDGAVDEPACTPDWVSPEGPETGACVPVSEVCGNAEDDDCDDSIDEDCTPLRCGCDWAIDGWQSHGPALLDILDGFLVAWNPRDREYGVVYYETSYRSNPGGDERVHFMRLAPDGTALSGEVASFLIGGGAHVRLSSFVWARDRYVLGYEVVSELSLLRSQSFLAALGPHGTSLGTPLPLGGMDRWTRGPSAIFSEGLVHVTFAEHLGADPQASTSELYLRRFTSALAPLGPPLRLTRDDADEAHGPSGLAFTGTKLAVLNQFMGGGPSTFVAQPSLILVEGNRVGEPSVLNDPSTPTFVTRRVAFGADRLLACWSMWYSGVPGRAACRLLDSNGTALGPVFEAGPNLWYIQELAVTFNGCEFLLATHGTDEVARRRRTHLTPIAIDGAIRPSIELSHSVLGSNGRLHLHAQSGGEVRFFEARVESGPLHHIDSALLRCL